MDIFITKMTITGYVDCDCGARLDLFVDDDDTYFNEAQAEDALAGQIDPGWDMHNGLCPDCVDSDESDD